jgi:uncharacterized protein with beta-barrel porin domain
VKNRALPIQIASSSARNVLVVEAGLDMGVIGAMAPGVSYAGQFGDGMIDQSFHGRVTVRS